MKYSELHRKLTWLRRGETWNVEQFFKRCRNKMNKTRVIIEGNENEGYSAYIKDNVLPYGLIGTGRTGKEVICDFIDAYNDMKALYDRKNLDFQEADFEFIYDLPSFLKGYAYAFTLAGLSRITGINQGQLSHYINGTSVPRPASIRKIQNGIRAFAIDLQAVNLL